MHKIVKNMPYIKCICPYDPTSLYETGLWEITFALYALARKLLIVMFWLWLKALFILPSNRWMVSQKHLKRFLEFWSTMFVCMKGFSFEFFIVFHFSKLWNMKHQKKKRMIISHALAQLFIYIKSWYLKEKRNNFVKQSQCFACNYWYKS